MARPLREELFFAASLTSPQKWLVIAQQCTYFYDSVWRICLNKRLKYTLQPCITSWRLSCECYSLISPVFAWSILAFNLWMFISASALPYTHLINPDIQPLNVHLLCTLHSPDQSWRSTSDYSYPVQPCIHLINPDVQPLNVHLCLLSPVLTGLQLIPRQHSEFTFYNFFLESY